MIRLPDSPRRVDTRAFILTFSVLVSTATGLAASAAGAVRPVLWGLACGAGVVAIGLSSRPFSMWAYHAWNRLAGLVARGNRIWLSAIAYLVLTLVGRAGSRLPWRTPGTSRSGWLDRETLDVEAFVGQGWHADRDADQRGWVASLSAWGLRGNGWIWGLLPFLVVIGWVDRGEVRAPTDRNYTLY